MDLNKKYEIATLGGGCFWCLDAIFSNVEGVTKVDSGYSGGHVANPSYEAVCSGTTGHAEVVQITFDISIISYKEILEIFFDTHDPTTLNRQGNDVGSQYRSVIFYHSNNQKVIAQEVISRLEELNVFRKPIVTELSPFSAFYHAENYHQAYYRKNPNQPYCRFIIDPKVTKFKLNNSFKVKI